MEGLEPFLVRLISVANSFAFSDARMEGRQRLIRFILPQKYETNLTLLPAHQLALVLATFEGLLSEFNQSNLDGYYPQVRA